MPSGVLLVVILFFQIAVCNLASIALPMYVSADRSKFNFQRLYEVTQTVTRNLDTIIDINYYPVKEVNY